MRTTFLMVAMLVAVGLPASGQQDDTVEWFDNYQKAMEEAKRTNKPIFLEFRCEA